MQSVKRGNQIGAWGAVRGIQRRQLTTVPASDTIPEGTVTDPSGGGFVMAPSPRQASTAGVLRAAWRAHGGASGGALAPFATGLTSTAVRRALTIAEGMRNGQQLGALLGYLLERGIHDASGVNGIEIDWVVFELRRQYPLKVDTIDNAPQASAQRLVADGWKLAQLETKTPGSGRRGDSGADRRRPTDLRPRREERSAIGDRRRRRRTRRLRRSRARRIDVPAGRRKPRARRRRDRHDQPGGIAAGRLRIGSDSARRTRYRATVDRDLRRGHAAARIRKRHAARAPRACSRRLRRTPPWRPRPDPRPPLERPRCPDRRADACLAGPVGARHRSARSLHRERHAVESRFAHDHAGRSQLESRAAGRRPAPARGRPRRRRDGRLRSDARRRSPRSARPRRRLAARARRQKAAVGRHVRRARAARCAFRRIRPRRHGRVARAGAGLRVAGCTEGLGHRRARRDSRPTDRRPIASPLPRRFPIR